MTLKEIQTLYDYDKWATLRTLDTLAPLSEDQFRKDLGSSHGGIQGTIVHIFSADRVWLERWKGNSPAPVKPEEIPTVEILKARWESYHREAENFTNTLTDQKLQDQLTYKDFKGNAHTQPLYQQMQHKVNHSSYHRGQIVTMLRQLGAKPQSTDLINYYRLLQKNV